MFIEITGKHARRVCVDRTERGRLIGATGQRGFLKRLTEALMRFLGCPANQNSDHVALVFGRAAIVEKRGQKRGQVR